MSPWLYLFFAGLCEVTWAIGLKYSDGFTRLWASVFTAVFMILSFVLLAQAYRAIPVGTAYAVWTGIGAVGTVIVSIALFHESVHPARLLSIAMIIFGILGLRFFSPQ